MLSGSEIHVESWDIQMFILEFLKPMCGLVDVPHLWQVALSLYLVDVLRARVSLWNENFVYWTYDNLPDRERDAHGGEEEATDGVAAAFSMHVDDLLVAVRARIQTYFIKLLEAKFGAVKRQQLLFTHGGAQCAILANGTI
eukprot:8201281-Pyramimonas_sp.AAC.1